MNLRPHIIKFQGLNLILALIASLPIYAGNSLDSKFSYESDTFADYTINYRKAELNSDCDSSHILVIYLHGGSGKGDDNRTQLEAPAVSDIFSYLKLLPVNSTFLVPQLPYGEEWDGPAIAAVKALCDKHAIEDSTEIYVIGASMGGIGAWNMLVSYPEYFTGAMPVACNTPKTPHPMLQSTRILSVIGGSDRKRNIAKATGFFKKLKKEGVQAEINVVYSWGHRQTCEWSFTPARLDWLFNRK